MSSNFDLDFNNNVENFEVEFGEVTRLTEDDFNQLRNRPSYNGNVMTGETNIPAVPTRTSDLQNDSDYQTGADVQSAISGKQDVLTPGTGINISNDTISIDSTVVATQQNLATEVTNRENADNALQSQIDAISASSDVVDIVGTYEELQNYDTSELSDNDIIKVLQDETQNNATTYYRWSTTTQTFTLIGQEGPYYTKASADAQFVPQTRTVNGKPLSTNITLDASDVSALGQADIAQTTGNSTTKVMSQKATTDELNAINNLLEGMPSDFFSGDALASAVTGTTLRIQNALSLDDMKMYGDTFQQTYSGKNLFNKDATPLYNNKASAEALPTGVRITTAVTSSGYCFVAFKVCDASDYEGQTITLTTNMESSSTNPARAYIGLSSADGGNRLTKVFLDASGSCSYTVEQDPDRPYVIVALYSTNSRDPVLDEYVDYTDLQIEVGSTATSYEPFTGGQPSPSPDYPQNIDVVTGVQTVTTSTTNLIDTANPYKDNYYISQDGVEGSASGFAIYGNLASAPNTTYSLSCTGASSATTLRIHIYNSEGVWQEQISALALPANTYAETQFTTPNYPCLIRISASKSLVGLKLEYGSSVVPSATYTIDLGSIELCKIGGYQDYIYKSGDDWYVHKEINKAVFVGTEQSLNYTNGVCYADVDSKADVDTEVLSNYFVFGGKVTNTSGAYSKGNYKITVNTGGTKARFYMRDDSLTMLSAWQTWLSSHNTIVYYVLQAPTDTQITDQTLIDGLNSALNMTCYDGETNVVVTSTNLAGALKLVAVNANAKGLIYKARKGA